MRFFIFILLQIITLSIFAQDCDCPKDMPVKLDMIDYSANRNDQFKLCFKDNDSYSRNGIYYYSSTEGVLLDVVNNKKFPFHSSFYKTEIYIKNENAVIRKILQIPQLKIDNPAGREFFPRAFDHHEIQKNGTLVRWDPMEIDKNLDEKTIHNLKTRFLKDLEKVKIDPESRLYFWEHAINLSVCAINGDKEAKQLLDNYISSLSEAKGRVYSLGHPKKLSFIDKNYFKDLTNLVEWHLAQNE
ncbi:hypothetical protein OO013_17185 [Mangrovivirga sp. M17]|uniref:DUF4369 domain-containing protein n=1 Tax=Mangrovivirga halotolerans TaxID=2993936 RepID=A0ABT3RV25_9BACT|nr:hypothetical protein [Mangrovivirga halotolerans]MCX2745619.1 hypothetical protein [Mangrovivirga halotolerans]